MAGPGRRYARALLDTCGPARAAAVQGDLAAFGAWLHEVPALRTTLENPGIPLENKHKLVAELARRGGFQPEAGRFVETVVAQRRLGWWEEIEKAFRDLCDAAQGVVRARLTTARPLTDARRRAFEARLKDLCGRPVELEAAVAPALVGGASLQVGSTVYDGSVAGSLMALRAALEKR